MTILLKNYFKEAFQKKGRIVTAVLLSSVLFFISYYYLSGGGVKRFALFTLLSLLTGALIAFPMPFPQYLSVPASIVYLCTVPALMFRRIEFPVHNLSILSEGAEFANILLILLVFAVLLLLLQRPHLAFGTGAALLLFCLCANYYVTLFRGSGISYSDLTAVGTALSVAGNYRLSMNAELWYSILYFCFFISFGFWCKVPHKGKAYHCAVTGISFFFLLFSWIFWDQGGYLEKHDLKVAYWNWNVLDNQKHNGFLLTFAMSLNDSSMPRPEGYSQSRLQTISQEARENFAAQNSEKPQAPDLTPNIILIMNEAWSDLRVLGNLETSEPFMPFFDALTKNTAKGNLHVDILGGVTANSEFEALTGDSLCFLPANAVPYQLQVDHDMSSLARVLHGQGYQTLAMHPSNAGAWNREKAYAYFGFDDFIELQEFATEYESIGMFVSDESNFDEIIYRYENKDPDKPLFLFNVTIQNHADYYFQVDTPITVEKIGNTQAAKVPYLYDDILTYINLMRVTDNAFEKLITYFSQTEEPTIICMFGDHQPKLSDHFYQAVFDGQELTDQEQEMLKHITPYVIWSNYDSGFSQYGDISANYLGPVLLECAGAGLPAYYQFLLELKEQYPVLSHIGCLDAEGNLYTVTDILDEPPINAYHILQYNHLMERNYQKSIFIERD